MQVSITGDRMRVQILHTIQPKMIKANDTRNCCMMHYDHSVWPATRMKVEYERIRTRTNTHTHTHTHTQTHTHTHTFVWFNCQSVVTYITFLCNFCTNEEHLLHQLLFLTESTDTLPSNPPLRKTKNKTSQRARQRERVS